MRDKGYILPKSYRKLGVGFFVLSILSTTFVFYLVWAKVIIIITPNTQTINSEFLFEVTPGGSIENGSVTGLVKTIEVEGNGTYKATGSKTLNTNLVGEVTIINNYSKEQSLIETTRLAYADDPDTVVVRLNKNVVVPAGGSVKVQVYPDNEDDFKKIESGQLIIPGLWGPLQEKIFAQVDAPLSKGSHNVSVATQEDLDKARDELKDKLYQQALDSINGELDAKQKLWPKLVAPNIGQPEYNVAVGEEVSEFIAKLKLNVVVVVFDEDSVVVLVQERLKENINDNLELVGLNPNNFNYKVSNYNIEAGMASINASILADSVLTSNAKLFDKTKMVGLTAEEVKSYFSQFSEVNAVEIEFHPSWLKKTPRFKDKIEISIAQ